MADRMQARVPGPETPVTPGEKRPRVLEPGPLTGAAGNIDTSELKIEMLEMHPETFSLPWHLPLEDWQSDRMANFPRGISRHVVRFARAPSDNLVYAFKEIGEASARHEYDMLCRLARLEAPAVEPVGLVTGRRDARGQRLADIVVTRYLQYSLPYRVLFGPHQSPATTRRLVDALSVLMARLHLLGFYWGDVSLSNTLFRRDAGAFAAYLVDAETADIFDHLTDTRREYDLDIARTNVIGELMDLQAGGALPEHFSPIKIGDMLAERYRTLWHELTAETFFTPDERWKINERVERLGSLGFEVDEMTVRTDGKGSQLAIRPKVVEAGHFSRQLERLTGLHAEENQARRLLNDIEQYRALEAPDATAQSAALAWRRDVFEPTVGVVPDTYKEVIEAAELYVSILDHRWYMSEKAGGDVTQLVAARDFVTEILARLPRQPPVVPLDASRTAV